MPTHYHHTLICLLWGSLKASSHPHIFMAGRWLRVAALSHLILSAKARHILGRGPEQPQQPPVGVCMCYMPIPRYLFVGGGETGGRWSDMQVHNSSHAYSM
eukprot:1146948-Pelagomonas_calceolata.AAC.2